MNGVKKWHPARSPAFSIGEQWCSGSSKTGIWTITIMSVRKFGEGKYDWDVEYRQTDGSVCSKDVWNFQIRYYHPADKELRVQVRNKGVKK